MIIFRVNPLNLRVIYESDILRACPLASVSSAGRLIRLISDI